MKKIIVLSVIIGLLSLIGCQNEPKNEPEKTPIMDEVLAGTWVNDSTPDISFTWDRYDNENQLFHCAGTDYRGIISLSRYTNNYLSADDLSSDTTKLSFVNFKDTNGHLFIIETYAHYENSKIKIIHRACVPVHGSETEKTQNFTRLNKELSGTYSKK